MAGRRRQGFDLHRILTLGDTVPRSVGGILLAMLVATVAALVSPGLWRWVSLDGPAIFSGQVWRLVSWVFPQGDPVTLLVNGLMLYWVGRDLANTWSERKFLQVFFGYAVWAALWTALVGEIWAAAARPYVSATPVVNALLVGWGLSRPGAQINLFGIVPLTGKVFAWLIIGGTILYALSSGAEAYVPHFAAIVLALLMDAGVTPRKLWLRIQQQWYGARLKRRSSHLRPVKGDRDTWMN